MIGANDRRTSSRRKALRAIAACSVCSLAGCSTIDNIRNGDSNRSEGRERTLRVPEAIQLGEHRINLNMYAGLGENVPRRALRYVSAKMGYTHPQTSERLPGLVLDWEYDDTEVTVTFHPEATYNTGDPIDPADFAYGLFLWPLLWSNSLPHNGGSRELYTAIEDIDVTDNVLTLQSPRGYLGQLREQKGANFWEGTIYSGRGWRHFANFRDISEAYWDLRQTVGLDHPEGEGTPTVTDTQREHETALREQLLSRVVTPDEAITTGPFKFERIGEGTMVLTKHDGYPYSDTINFGKVQLDSMPDDRTVWGALRADEIDGIDSITTPEHVTETFPNHLQQVVSPTDTISILQFNFNTPELADRRVRQALAHVIDRRELARNVHEFVRTPVSWHAYLESEFLADGSSFPTVDDTRELVDSFEGYEPDAPRAAELLREGGFHRVGGKWETPEGEPWQLRISTSEQNPVVEVTIKQQLEAFGIDVEVLSTEETALETAVSRGNYELVHRTVPREWAFTSEVAVESMNDQNVNREVNVWQNQLPQLMDELDYEWEQNVGSRIRLGETVQSSVDDGRLLDFYRERDLDILTWQYDTTRRYGEFERHPVDDVAAGSVTAGWVDHRTQLQLRLRMEASPLGVPAADRVEWPVAFLRDNIFNYPPTGSSIESNLRTHLALADRWISNEQLFHLPLVGHRSQGFINTRDWEISTEWIDNPAHFSIPDLIATNNIRATSTK